MNTTQKIQVEDFKAEARRARKPLPPKWFEIVADGQVVAVVRGKQAAKAVVKDWKARGHIAVMRQTHKHSGF